MENVEQNVSFNRNVFLQQNELQEDDNIKKHHNDPVSHVVILFYALFNDRDYEI